MGRKSKQSERWARNKSAFDEIIGDPYSLPDPINGHYAELKQRSSIKIAELNDSSSGTANPARPNHLDFFVDVESAITDGLDVYAKEYSFDGDVYETFLNTYVFELSKEFCFTQKERADVEQLIGHIFITRGIYPAAKYFTTIRK